MSACVRSFKSELTAAMFNLNDLPLLITDMPPVTGLYLVAMLATSILVSLDFIHVYDLHYSAFMIFRKFQFYRLLTSFLYVGEFDSTPVFYMIFMGSYMRLLEVRCYYRRTGDFLYFIFVIMLIFNIFQLFYKMHFMATNLLMVYLYVWSRFRPDEVYSILGVIEFKGIYLPYAFAVISLMFEPNHWKNDVLGILVGHCYFYLHTVFPQLPYGFNILKTPVPL